MKVDFLKRRALTDEGNNHRIIANLRACQERIRRAEADCGRPSGEVTLLAVSKNRTENDIAAAVAGGQTRFGESRIQEALPKINALSSTLNAPIEWHFIGPIQSNKTKAIAEHFVWVHSVCRASIAEKLSAHRPKHLEALNVCVQVNISEEASKSGVAAGDAEDLLRAVQGLPGLRLRGLMAIPARKNDRENDCEKQRRVFADFRRLYESLAKAYRMDTLSIGMSDDFEEAIAEGATMVRIGRGIFDTSNSN